MNNIIFLSNIKQGKKNPKCKIITDCYGQAKCNFSGEFKLEQKKNLTPEIYCENIVNLVLFKKENKKDQYTKKFTIFFNNS